MTAVRNKKENRQTANAAGALSRLFLVLLLLGFGLLIFPASAGAQDESAPPPAQSIGKDERQKLNQTSSMKDRVKLSLELMDGHLTAAERLQESDNIDGAYRELGRFHGLLNDALRYLVERDRRGEKVFDGFKRLEMGVRSFAPRIESIRRECPLKYDDYIQALLKRVRDVRAAAADQLFSDTVVPEEDN